MAPEFQTFLQWSIGQKAFPQVLERSFGPWGIIQKKAREYSVETVEYDLGVYQSHKTKVRLEKLNKSLFVWIATILGEKLKIEIQD